MNAQETQRDVVEPRIRQLSFFLPNRLGSMRQAIQELVERDIRIGGVSVLEAADHAVVRIVVDRPDAAYEALTQAGYGGCITEILGVVLPTGPRFGIQRVLSNLLGAEVSLTYCYGLILQSDGHPVLALQADDLELATRVLRRHRFSLVGQDALQWPDARQE